MTGTCSAEAILSVPELRGPRISPSGRRIAFWSDQTGRPEVWVADASTDEVWQVTERQSGSFVGIGDYTWPDDAHLLIHAPENEHVVASITAGGERTRSFPIEFDNRTHKAATSDARYLLWNLDGLHRFDLVTGDRETPH